MNYVFIIEAYNDLDMIAPIIWKFTKCKNSNVVIVNTSPKIISSNNYLIKFLRKNKFVKYFEIPKTLNDISKHFFSKLKIGWIHNNYLNKFLKHPQKYFDKIPVEKSSPTIVFVSYFEDHNAVKSSLAWAKKHKFFKIFVDHGINPFLIKNDSIKKNKISPFDIYIVNNKNSESKIPYLDNKNIKKIYSSPRFSKEWSEQLNNIHSKDLLKYKNNKFRTVFMLSKWKGKDDKKKILSIVKATSKIKDTEVLIKPHTRGMVFKESLPPNVVIMDSNIHSRQLIEISDVTIFTRSSIFFDALLLNKPFINLSFATKVDLISDTLNFCKTFSQKDFISKLNKIRSGKKIYTQQERKKCFDFFVGRDDGKMLDDIVGQIKDKVNETIK